jgi:hypothetical protein
MEFTSDQLLRINAFQNEKRPNYTEVESAIKDNGSEVKNPLLNSPFLICLSMEQESGRRNTEHTTTWPCSSKIASTAYKPSILNLILSGSSTTVVAITEAEQMVY